MKTTIVRTAATLAVFFAPAIAFAGSAFNISTYSYGGCDVYFCWLGNMIIGLINNVLVPVLFAIAFIVFLYGIAEAYIFSKGDPEKVKSGHKLVLWGIVAFAIMISIWGLVNVVANTFGLSGYGAPALPVSY
ncbi:MAG: hypothetical protein Q8O94_00910 [bacterium]|nr:hypothetical protein [bacterium]